MEVHLNCNVKPGERKCGLLIEVVTRAGLTVIVV